MKRSAIWLLAILALVAATLFVFSPAALHSRPPPIAQGEDWFHFEAASRKLTEVLQSKFPVGSRDDILKSILLDQGFRPEQKDKRKRTLVYEWGGLGCVESISVVWSSDELGALTHVEGSYHGACL
ncbi:hypothetical protein [Bradyrhizobium sp.]|uniref:hypothetical protein n=1 Tax=Bradyrhizobium sp. TaxID=376 RepID=UPI003C15FF4B